MKLKKIDLPRKYQYKEGESRPEYKKYEGWNKISISQVNSFSDETYKGGYFYQYFLGIKEDSGIFAYFGSACGDFLNRKDKRVDPYLSEEDKKILDAIEQPENAEYEYEILIDLEPFGLEKTCLQGFSDIQYEVKPKLLDVADYKTLNMDKKAFYKSDDYIQTQIYGYGLEELGFKINETYVVGLGRKGNSLEPGAKYPMKLSGVVERIENPYDRKKGIEAIKTVVKTCLEIDKYYKTYNRYFND